MLIEVDEWAREPRVLGFRVLGFRVWGLRFGGWGLGFREFRGLGFRV